MTDERETGLWCDKDGRAWRIGAEAEVAWIRENTEVSLSITSAIPPVFEAYAWWLGYLETGCSDIVFYDVPKVRPGTSDAWYVLVEAGPEQARVWRDPEHSKGPLPDLMFPADRSWLLSTLWDDDWTCIGGSRILVDAFLTHPDLRPRAREVDPSLENATPPGHTAI